MAGLKRMKSRSGDATSCQHSTRLHSKHSPEELRREDASALKTEERECMKCLRKHEIISKIMIPGHVYLSKEQRGLAVNPLPASVYHGLAQHTKLEEAAPTPHLDGRVPTTPGIEHHHGTRTIPCTNRKSQSLRRRQTMQKHQNHLAKLAISLAAFLMYQSFSPAFCRACSALGTGGDTRQSKPSLMEM